MLAYDGVAAIVVWQRLEWDVGRSVLGRLTAASTWAMIRFMDSSSALFSLAALSSWEQCKQVNVTGDLWLLIFL